MTAALNGAEVMKLKDLLRAFEIVGNSNHFVASLLILAPVAPILQQLAHEISLTGGDLAKFVQTRSAKAGDFELLHNTFSMEIGALKDELSVAIARFNEAAAQVQALADQLREEKEILVIAQQSTVDPNWGSL